MGLWGASQALAFGLGGLLGSVASDLAHYLLGEQGTAYACVFAFESVMFVLAAACAIWVGQYDRKVSESHRSPLSLSMERI
jgi:BCD family chlorophyll transporter-like MFS transporter